MSESVAPTSSVATPQRAPILPLTSARIFAAAYVVLLHCYYWTNSMTDTTWFGRFVRNGYTAVGFFFCLSGYILAYVYLDTGKPFSRRSFWISRFARVYPLLFASLLLDVPRLTLEHMAHHGAAKSVMLTMVALVSESFLLQAWVPKLFLALNGPSWSLSCEAFFYLMFPFVAFWLWKKRGGAALTIFFVLWTIALSAPILITILRPELFTEVKGGSNLQMAAELMPLFRIFEFMAGIALYTFHASFVSKSSAAVRSRLGYVFLLAAAILFFVAIQFSNGVPLLVMSDGFLLPVYALIILGLTDIQGWLQYLLSRGTFVILGEASYAVYLLHEPLFFYVLRGRNLSHALPWVAYLAAVLIVSLCSFYFLERPARKRILAWATIRPAITLQEEGVSPR